MLNVERGLFLANVYSSTKNLYRLQALTLIRIRSFTARRSTVVACAVSLGNEVHSHNGCF